MRVIPFGERLPAAVGERRGRYAHIDALRAVAVMLVVLAHAGLGSIIPGGSGVTIFFSISGFIITFLLLRERDRTGGFSVRRFYARRFLKIAPPLAVVVLVPTIAYASVGHDVSRLGFGGQVFFFFNWLYATGRGSGRILPGSEVLWSLSIEEQFYIVFAVVWLAAVRLRHAAGVVTVLAAAVCLGSLVARIHFAHDVSNTWRIYYGTDTRAEAIALGTLTAVAYHSVMNRLEPPRWARLVAADASLTGACFLYLLSLGYRDAWFRDTFRYSLQSIATCIVILYGLLATDTRGSRAVRRAVRLRGVQFVGLASYSIYLVHEVLMEALRPAVGWLPSPARFLLLVALGVGAGSIVYVLVEVPLERVRAALHRGASVRPRATTATPAPADP